MIVLLQQQIAANLSRTQVRCLSQLKTPLRVSGFDLVLKGDDGVLRRTDLGCDVLDEHSKL